MSSPRITVGKFVREQQGLFENSLTDDEKEKTVAIPAVTVSMEPGSGGFMVAEALAKRLGYDLYHKNILNAIAASADTNSEVMELIEKERFSKIQDFVTALLQEQYVYSGDYLQHLKRIVTSLGIIGRAVIVGRGANLILPPEKRFAIRIIAPEEIRVKNVAFRFGVSLAEAKKRVKNRENKRKTFIKNTFHKDIADIASYDLVINTARLDLPAAVETVIGAILGAQKNRVLEKAAAFILRSEK
ncbi:MAG: cytidylate kinase-like family protein [Deltaproteobacteria bacterium]|nr:cytidylate kinase-like family protein [Deltaproteobacteria bacterium]